MYYGVETNAKPLDHFGNGLAHPGTVPFLSAQKSLKKAYEWIERLQADGYYKSVLDEAIIYGFSEPWHEIGTKEKRENRALFKDIVKI